MTRYSLRPISLANVMWTKLKLFVPGWESLKPICIIGCFCFAIQVLGTASGQLWCLHRFLGRFQWADARDWPNASCGSAWGSMALEILADFVSEPFPTQAASRLQAHSNACVIQ